MYIKRPLFRIKDIVFLLFVVLGPSLCFSNDFDIYDCDEDCSDSDMTFLTFDPLERFNRKIGKFNDRVDFIIVDSMVDTYTKVTPVSLRKGFSNIFNNFQKPSHALSALIQGNPKESLNLAWNFLLNFIFGFGGMGNFTALLGDEVETFPFSDLIRKGSSGHDYYMVLPILGSSSLAELSGLVFDLSMNPINYFLPIWLNGTIAGLYLLQMKMDIKNVEKMTRKYSVDSYIGTRSVVMQNIEFQEKKRKNR